MSSKVGLNLYFLIVYTVCPRSSGPFYILIYYIKWIANSWTGGNIGPISFYTKFLCRLPSFKMSKIKITHYFKMHFLLKYATVQFFKMAATKKTRTPEDKKKNWQRARKEGRDERKTERARERDRETESDRQRERQRAPFRKKDDNIL